VSNVVCTEWAAGIVFREGPILLFAPYPESPLIALCEGILPRSREQPDGDHSRTLE